MPGEQSFEQGFNLKKGVHIGGYIITAVHGHENAVSRFHTYEYPITIEFVAIHLNTANPAALIQVFSEVARRPTVIHSQHGTPYRCTIRNVLMAPSTSPFFPMRVTLTGLGACAKL